MHVQKCGENLAKQLAAFHSSTSRKSGRKKFHAKSSTDSTSRETKFFNRETLGAEGPKNAPKKIQPPNRKVHLIRTSSTTTRDRNLQFRGDVSTGGSPLDFCFFSSSYMQFSKTSPLKSGGENCVKSCHVCGCHGFFGPDLSSLFVNYFCWAPDSCHRKAAGRSSPELFEEVCVNMVFSWHFRIWGGAFGLSIGMLESGMARHSRKVNFQYSFWGISTGKGRPRQGKVLSRRHRERKTRFWDVGV